MKLVKTASGEKKLRLSRKEWKVIGKKASFVKISQFGNTEYLEIGPTPNGEDCAQVGSDDYSIKSRVEGRAYAHQLMRMFPNPPDGVTFTLKSFPHDFGSYLEVVVKYPIDNEEAENFAFNVENNAPENWDEEAKAELTAKGYFNQSQPEESMWDQVDPKDMGQQNDITPPQDLPSGLQQ